jgi:tRNA-splicing ligase RtcB
MMRRVIEGREDGHRQELQSHTEAVNCHHNYVQQEHHFGKTCSSRKGAVSAQPAARHHPGKHGRAQRIVRGGATGQLRVVLARRGPRERSEAKRLSRSTTTAPPPRAWSAGRTRA